MLSLNRIKNNILHLAHLLLLPHNVISYLQKGTYKYNKSCTLLYNIDYEHEAKAFSENLFGEHCTINNPFRNLFSKVYRRFKIVDGGKCSGVMLVISTSGHEYKIIDLANQKMITFFDNIVKFKRIVENRKYWQNYFRTIKFEANFDRKAIIENLVEKTIMPSELVFSYVMQDYKNYLQGVSFTSSQKVNQNELKEYCNKIGMEADYESLRKYLNSSEYRKCIVHGDVWISNLIVTKEGVYYTDFETVGPRVFYYDLLLYIVTEYLTMRNTVCIQNYAEGKYDKDFEELFNLAGLSYRADMKRLYLEAFFFEHYLEKWFGTDNEDNLRLVTKTLNNNNLL